MHTMENRPTPPARSTRAKIACTACRLRKVRCDVSHRASPCTNCFLDHKECVVDALTRYRRENAERRPKRKPRTPHHPEPVALQPAPIAALRPEAESHPSPSTVHSTECLNPSSEESALLQLLENRPEDEGPAATGSSVSDISFSVYQFIRSSFLLTLEQDDVKYLEDQSCLRVPRRNVMNEMMNQYFRHLHPILPIFNEASFWAMYHPVRHSAMGHQGKTMSLFVTQAMLFAACSFVSLSKLRRIGFSSVRHARKCLYRRAKLLYSLDTESDQTALAQGALLLSLWCPRENDQQVNSWWLATAIQHARAAQAHRYHLQEHLPETERLELKRLWWACVVRDRVIALGLRQPILITRESFDFGREKLTINDVKDEGDGPSVYDKELKRILLVITVCLCDLCAVLTGMLALVPPLSKVARLPEHHTQVVVRLEQFRASLQAWRNELTYHLSLFQVHYRSDSSVALFTNLLQMYYHSSQIMISNYEIQLEAQGRSPQAQREVNISRLRGDVQASAMSIADLLRDLVQLNLVNYLPMSALTCTAQPLVLYLLDQTLAHVVTASTQSKLATLIEAMRVYQYLYDNTDLVLSTAHRISIQARATLRNRPITGWGDILSQDPKTYIRFIVTMEVALSKGVFPQDSDLPFTSIAPEEANEAEGQGASPALYREEQSKAQEIEQYSCLPRSLSEEFSPRMAPPTSQNRAIIMPATLDVEIEDVDEEVAVSKPGEEASGSIEPFLLDPDTLLESMLGSYITEGTASAEIVGLPWGSGTLFED
ncbi:fungal-specific transcription factor domain-containing protein [Aspergillus navahoensis]